MITLVIGGTRSGKSELAAQLAARSGGSVTVIVPTVVTDADFAERIRAHQDRRPPSWTTIECGFELPAAIRAATGTVLVDSLGSWIAATTELLVDTPALLDALAARTDPTVLVTEEVGLAVHPTTEAGRRFADRLGALNTDVAAIAEPVLLVVAGRVTRLDPLGRLVPER